MVSNRVNAAVVGLGTFGQIHARTYSQYDKTDLVSICDLNKEKVASLSEELNCDYCSDSKEIALDDNIDIVSIATPDYAHLDVALSMIEAGKDILVEKPLATSSQEARTIVNKAEENSVHMMTDFQNRWSPPFVTAKKAIENGDIGEPIMLSAELSNNIKVPLEHIKWSDKSGPEWFLFPHIIDLGIWLLKQRPRKVFATGQKKILKSKGIDAYDAIQAEILFEDSFGVFKTAWVMPEEMSESLRFEFDMLGSEGKFEATPSNNGIKITSEEGDRIPFISGWQENSGAVDGFFMEPIKHFVDHVYFNRELGAEPEDGIIVTKTIESILKSIKSEKVISVE